MVLALLLSREIRGQRLFRVLFTLPLVVPPVVVGICWKFMYNSEVGVIGAYFLPRILQIPIRTLLGSPSTSIYAVALADVWNQTPLVFLILLAGIESIPSDYYEAARIDGASSWQIFRHITIRQLEAPILLVLLFRFIGAINTFDTIFAMTEGGPGDSTMTLVIIGEKMAFYYFRMGLASAFAVLIVIFTFSVVFFAVIKYLR